MRNGTLKIALFVVAVLVGVLGCANMAWAANAPGPAVKLTQYFTTAKDPNAARAKWTDNLVTNRDFGWTRITAYDANGKITSASNVKVQMIGPWSKTFQPGVPDLVEQPWPAAVALSNPNVGLQGQRTVPEFFGNQVAGNYWENGTYAILAWADANNNNAVDPGEAIANVNTLRLVGGCEGHPSH